VRPRALFSSETYGNFVCHSCGNQLTRYGRVELPRPPWTEAVECVTVHTVFFGLASCERGVPRARSANGTTIVVAESSFSSSVVVLGGGGIEVGRAVSL
jgi:hypothetical protein